MKIAICDDDDIFLSKLSNMLSGILNEQTIDYELFSFSDGEGLLAAAESSDFDLIFLDIDMPKIDGMKTAETLRNNIQSKAKLVFISSYYEKVFSTFQYDIASFVPKDKIDEYLVDEVQRILGTVDNKRDIFLFRFLLGNKTADGRLYFDEITYVESVMGDVIVHTKDAQYKLVNYGFEKIKSVFSDKGFADVHRTCVVGIRNISFVKENSVVLDGGVEIPLSRRKKARVKEAFLSYIKEQIKR